MGTDRDAGGERDFAHVPGAHLEDEADLAVDLRLAPHFELAAKERDQLFFCECSPRLFAHTFIVGPLDRKSTQIEHLSYVEP